MAINRHYAQNARRGGVVDRFRSFGVEFANRLSPGGRRRQAFPYLCTKPAARRRGLVPIANGLLLAFACMTRYILVWNFAGR